MNCTFFPVNQSPKQKALDFAQLKRQLWRYLSGLQCNCSEEARKQPFVGMLKSQPRKEGLFYIETDAIWQRTEAGASFALIFQRNNLMLPPLHPVALAQHNYLG